MHRLSLVVQNSDEICRKKMLLQFMEHRVNFMGVLFSVLKVLPLECPSVSLT